MRSIQIQMNLSIKIHICITILYNYVITKTYFKRRPKTIKKYLKLSSKKDLQLIFEVELGDYEDSSRTLGTHFPGLL